MADETTGPEATAQAAATGEVQGAPETSGLQQRIDQLTAKAGNAERQAAEVTKAFQQSMERIANLEGRLAATTPNRTQAEPEVDYSAFGEAADPLKKVVDSVTARFQRQLAQQQANFDAQLRTTQVQALASSVAGLPPAVAERANNLAVAWAAKGMPVIASDALDFAIGEAVRNGTYKPNGSPQGGGRVMGGNPSGATMTGNQTPNVQSNGGGPRAAALPVNFENLPPAKQEEWAAKNGYDFDL